MIKEEKLGEITVFWAGINFYQGLTLGEMWQNRLFSRYHLICLERNKAIPILRKKGWSIFSLEEKIGPREKVPRNTGHLLAHPQTINFIKRMTRGRAAIACFKPSPKIEKIVQENGWLLLSNTTAENRFFENKINFFLWAKKNNLPLVPGEIRIIRKSDFAFLKKRWGNKFLIQLGRGWAGKGSFLIEKEKDFLSLFLERERIEAKVTNFLEGKTILNNACLFPQGKLLLSPPARQIDHLPSIGGKGLATCGRQWPADLTPEQEKEIAVISRKTARLMAEKGYRGFLGLDFLIDKKGKVFLLECNPRLTASFVFYSQLEKKAGVTPLAWWHFLIFLGHDPKDLEKEEKKREKMKIIGSELVQRNIFPERVLVKGEFTSGKYNQEGDFIGMEFTPEKEKWVVVAPKKGKIIKPGEEIFRIIAARRFLSREGRLEEEVRQEREKILSQLKIKRYR